MTAQEGRQELRADTLESLERELGVLVRRARRVIGERAALVHPDLPRAAYLILALLIERGPQRPSVVSEVFELDKGAVSRQVQQLVDLGLATRSPDPDDGRATILAATPVAVDGMARAVAHHRARFRDRLGEWDDDALAEFVSGLARYNRTLEGPVE